LLAKHGNQEIRLLELRSIDAARMPSLWVELYATDAKMSVDACRCDDLEVATLAAEHLISQAAGLNDNDAS